MISIGRMSPLLIKIEHMLWAHTVFPFCLPTPIIRKSLIIYSSPNVNTVYDILHAKASTYHQVTAKERFLILWNH